MTSIQRGFCMRLFHLIASMFALLFCCTAIAEETVPFRGYDPETHSYQYVIFGTYPYTEEGNDAPVLWRVLGPGTPGDDDVLVAEEVAAYNKDKYSNGDAFTEDTADVYCLMTEYIIDTVLYNDVRDEEGGPTLDYWDTLIYRSLNGEILGRLLTDSEQSALLEMPGRGRLSLPSRKGELFRRDYGFADGDFTKDRRRRAAGTPYAFSQGLRHISGVYSWHWTTDWRAYGRRWIVGDDGHISVSGLDREGGIRPVIYVHTDMLRAAGGSGTLEDPYQLVIR